MNGNKPIAEACLRNQKPIFETLQPYLDAGIKRVLELGSGTGQHALYIAEKQPNIRWQCSDLASCLSGISAWINEAATDNLPEPMELDADRPPFPVPGAPYDAVFTANTIHFVSERTALRILEIASDALGPSGSLFIYGPFNDQGRFTSEGNIRLDAWLKMRNPESGIRDFQWVESVCRDLGMVIVARHEMPANNSMLVFHK